METPETIRTSLQQGEWVTSIDFKDAYFHIPIQEQSRKFLRFHVQGQTYQFKALPFGLSTAPLEFTVVAKEIKLMAIHKGIRIHQYLDDWLVRAKSHQVCLQHTKDLLKLCQDLGWIVNLEKSELEPKQVFDFVGYQFDLKAGRVRPTPEWWQNLKAKIQAMLARPSCPVRQFMSLIGLPNGHRKASLSRPTTHEAYTVAPEKQLESTAITRKGDSNTHFSSPRSGMVVRRRQRATRPIVTPTKTCSADLYRCIKRRVGRSLKRAHSQRRLVSTRKQATHKLSSSKGVSATRSKPNSPCSYRQHHSSVLHKQGRRHEVRPTLCPTVENLDMVYSKPSYPQSQAHSRPAECGSGQTFQTRPDYSNRMVSPHRGFSDHMRQVASTSNRPLCHEVQQQTPSVCLTSARLPGHCSRCTRPSVTIECKYGNRVPKTKIRRKPDSFELVYTKL